MKTALVLALISFSVLLSGCDGASDKRRAAVKALAKGCTGQLRIAVVMTNDLFGGDSIRFECDVDRSFAEESSK